MEEELNKVMQNQQHHAQPVQTGKHIIDGLNMSENAVLVFKKGQFLSLCILLELFNL